MFVNVKLWPDMPLLVALMVVLGVVATQPYAAVPHTFEPVQEEPSGKIFSDRLPNDAFDAVEPATIQLRQSGVRETTAMRVR